MNDEFDGLIRFACQLVCQTVILAVGNDVSFFHLMSFARLFVVSVTFMLFRNH